MPSSASDANPCDPFPYIGGLCCRRGVVGLRLQKTWKILSPLSDAATSPTWMVVVELHQ